MATQKTILYDDNCPLCCWYTDAFVQTGLLTPEGRQSFTNTSLEDLENRLDLARSKDEIPLLDDHGGPTLYGIDSLLFLLGQRWAWMPKIARFAPINWFLRRLYKLISYNRRVIVAKETPAGAFDCSPQFNYFYRYVYILLTLLVGASGLLAYGLTNGTWYLLGLITLFLLFLLLKIKEHPKRVNYLGLIFTPFIPMGVLLWVAAFFPILSLAFAGFSGLLGGWMWYRRLALVNTN
ncbi:DCC1-like thiol-disulfide oxidoreductase family protein [Lewinella cohaerens]|uniref:DCC1-like thiol-disulfide oxidoreductase family protein n=1 Tax=Lewinella cohaerens TaxID=70995 RepID=UPI00037E8885|nr:DCC1-like thiol-disulfide oxidoreductase family protein [Lewinella cohaerens]